MASTVLNEQGLPPDVIELQLAGTERHKVRAPYNEAQRLPERRNMMQAWANYLGAMGAMGTTCLARVAPRADADVTPERGDLSKIVSAVTITENGSVL